MLSWSTPSSVVAAQAERQIGIRQGISYEARTSRRVLPANEAIQSGVVALKDFQASDDPA